MTVRLHNVTPTLAVMTAVTLVLWVAVVIYWIDPYRDRELDSESTPTTAPVRAGAAPAIEADAMVPKLTDANTPPHAATQPDRWDHDGEVLR
jgi:hypothetical protein